MLGVAEEDDDGKSAYQREEKSTVKEASRAPSKSKDDLSELRLAATKAAQMVGKLNSERVQFIANANKSQLEEVITVWGDEYAIRGVKL